MKIFGIPITSFSLLLLGEMIIGICSAFVTRAVRDGSVPWYCIYLTGFVSISLWSYIARQQNWNLILSGIVFDLVYNACWYGTLAYFGEPISWTQGIAVTLIVLGMVLLGI